MGPRRSSGGGWDDGSRVCWRDSADATERDRDLENDDSDVDGVTERGGDGGCCFNLKWITDSCRGGAADVAILDDSTGDLVGERMGAGLDGKRSRKGFSSSVSFWIDAL